MYCKKFTFADAHQLAKTDISTIGKHNRHFPFCLRARSWSFVLAKARQGSGECDLKGAISRTVGLTRTNRSSQIRPSTEKNDDYA